MICMLISWDIMIILLIHYSTVAQSRSLHVVHEVYLCKSCFRNDKLLSRHIIKGSDAEGEDQDDDEE